MSTIAEKLQIILNAKTAIKSAIEAKGVSDVGDKIENYATKIGEISGSSSEYSDLDGMIYSLSTITEFPEGWKFAPRSGKNCVKMFSTCKSLTTIPQLDTTKGTDFYEMFYYCSSLTTIPQLDTSSGTNFRDMFSDCTNLTTIPQLDTSSGTSFRDMFSNCTNLSTIPQLDTSSGTAFLYMLFGCTNLTAIPQLNTTNGTDFSYMFYQCSSLTAIPQLDTTKGTNFSYMLFGCKSLITLGGFIGLSKSLSLSYSNNLTHDSLMNVINNLATVTSSTTLTLGSTNLAKLTDEEKKVATDKGWTLA